jgi:phage terminase small subunit
VLGLTDPDVTTRVSKSPASQVLRDHSKAFLELARQYGLTPAARSSFDLERLGGLITDDDEADADLFGS